MAEALQNGAKWVRNNRGALLEMGLGATLIAGGEMVKRGGQGAGFTIAASGSIGTVGVGSPVAVGAGITIGVSATAIGTTMQVTGAALLAEGSRNLKRNDNKNHTYKSNPKHHRNSKSPEPSNAEEMFNKSIKDPEQPNKFWYKDAKGTIHRFQGKNGEFYWNGSTAGENPISPNDIPIEIKRLPEGEIYP